MEWFCGEATTKHRANAWVCRPTMPYTSIVSIHQPRGDSELSSEGFYKLPISLGVHSMNMGQTTTDPEFGGACGAVEGVHHGPLCVSPFYQDG